MALSMKLCCIALILFISMVIVVSAQGDTFAATLWTDGKLNCKQACGYRCSKASRAKLCHKFCHICCKKCNCVPPGTAGNREACPCYANLKNSKGKGKCP